MYRQGKQADYAALFTPEQVAAVKYWRGFTADNERTRRATEHGPREIEHIDRGGKRWRFCPVCTSQQANALNDLLAGFRAMGGRQGLTVTGILNADDNETFFTDLENVFLSALSQRFPDVPTASRGDAEPGGGPSNDERSPSEAGKNGVEAGDVPQRDCKEKAVKYWWEDD